MFLWSVPSCFGICSCARHVSKGRFELYPTRKWKMKIFGKIFKILPIVQIFKILPIVQIVQTVLGFSK